MARLRDASFRALHFDPIPLPTEADQQKGWREWLRQANLFQFLPHMLLSTPGCCGADLSVGSGIGPANSPSAGFEQGADGSAASPPSREWAESLRFAADHARDCLDLLAALQGRLDPQGIEPPEFGYELEGPLGESSGELEMAWPRRQVAVVLDERVEPIPEGWRLFPIHTPADVVMAAIQP
jgi:DEAD/DEAH box helicase domain-containing protein